MWQKERLLNVALRAVSPQVQAVVRLDCDVIFRRNDWWQETSRVLQDTTLVQPFETLIDLPPGATDQGSDSRNPSKKRASLTSLIATQTVPMDVFRKRGASLRWGYSVGHARTARRTLLEEYGFYDARILGSGDD